MFLLALTGLLVAGSCLAALLLTAVLARGRRSAGSVEADDGGGGGGGVVGVVGSFFALCTRCCAKKEDTISPAIATTNPELNRKLLLNNNGSKPTHPLPQPQQQQQQHRQQQQQQQLYDSVPSGTYYSAVPLDGSYSNNSDHYSEVSFGGGTPHENPSNGVKHFKTAPPHSHCIPPQQRGRSAIHSNGERSMIYANEPLPRNVLQVAGGGGGLGEYETAEAQAQYSWDSQKPLIPPPPQYSYAFVGRPEVVAGEASEYTEPAKDEDSLYAQFKSLNIRLIKKNVVKLGDYLGSGQFGTVYRGEWSGKLKTVVAVKTLNAKPRDEDKVRFLQEAAIMGQFSHTNVIKMHGLVIEKEPFMIVLEFLPKGDLRKHLHSLRPQGCVDSDLPHVLLHCCQQVAFGMDYLSNKGFVHRDLATRNILVAENGTCKVADFGMSRDLAHENYYISHGGQIPVKWTAPEAMHYRKYSTASDVWSFGVVMYEIWSLGRKPFEEYTNNRALSLIDRGIRLAPPPGCPRAIYSFMIDCWNPVSSERPTFRETVKYLLSSKDQLLKWSVKEKAVHLAACHLGADLEVAENLHKDLSELYLNNKR